MRKLRRPYELAKFLAFWTFIVVVSLCALYYISVGLYLSFYFFVLRPPDVVNVVQPLNLRYPDPDVREYVYAYHCVAPITYPQTYRWKLSLELPENPTNFDAGVFMVSLALYPPNKLPTQSPAEVSAMFYHHLQSNVGNPSIELEPIESGSMRIGSRPLMLRWRPMIYQAIQTLVYAAPRLGSDILGLGWFEETQTLETHLIERQATSRNATRASKQCFVVSINNPKVQIYRATIEATVLLEGWRYWLYYWFWTGLLLGSFAIFGFLVWALTTYLLGKLLLAVLKGEAKFPKIWMSEEEEKMADMKRAVSSLMQLKKRESQSKLDLQHHKKVSSSSPTSTSPPTSRRKVASGDRYGPTLSDASASSSSTPFGPLAQLQTRQGTRTRFADILAEQPSLSLNSNESATRPQSWLDDPIEFPSIGDIVKSEATEENDARGPRSMETDERESRSPPLDWDSVLLASSSSSQQASSSLARESDIHTPQQQTRKNRFARNSDDDDDDREFLSPEPPSSSDTSSAEYADASSSLETRAESGEEKDSKSEESLAIDKSLEEVDKEYEAEKEAKSSLDASEGARKRTEGGDKKSSAP